jgi:dTDP-glucose pyrophosphorylase
MRRMLDAFRAQGAGAVLAIKNESDPEAVRKNFSVTLSPEGLVTRVIEKPRYVHNTLKGVGVYLFGLTIFDAIRRTPRTAMRDEYELTESIQVMIDDGHPVRVSEAVIDDINLTFPADLLRCNLMLAAEHPEQRLVDASARVNPQARIHQSVIGAKVDVRTPISIRRSLILSNSVVTSTADLEDVVVAPHGVFDCRIPLAG